MGEVLQELEDASIQTPVVIEQMISGGLRGMSCPASFLGCWCASRKANRLLKDWGDRGQLILEFHWYPNAFTPKSLPDMITLAKSQAANISKRVPIYLGEFDQGMTSEAYANGLALAANSGCNVACYWLYADTEYTQQPGMFKYSAEVTANGQPFDVNTGAINMKSWPAYEKSVIDRSFWGAWITGAGGGFMNVLELLPETVPAGTGEYGKETQSGGLNQHVEVGSDISKKGQVAGILGVAVCCCCCQF